MAALEPEGGTRGWYVGAQGFIVHSEKEDKPWGILSGNLDQRCSHKELKKLDLSEMMD